jgi:hypothetical protein
MRGSYARAIVGPMASTRTAVTVGPGALAELHAAELPQKDNLCGCFWVSIALQAAGVEGHGGEPVDQDRVALASGTLLPEGDPSTFVPAGETSRQDYRVSLPTVSDPVESGSAAPSLAAAVEELSGGELAAVPVAGPWTEESVADLVRTAGDAVPAATLVANVRTGALWGTRPDPGALLAYLAGGEPQGPQSEWDVGHFVNIAAIAAGGDRALVLVRDSYSSLGWDGHHFQPASAFAAGLQRGDGREGGVLCIVASSAAAALRERLTRDGFELRHWDNGTPRVRSRES